MDYRYEKHDKAKDFHKKRKAFIILDRVIEFLPDNSEMSHYDYCLSKGFSKEEFNKITRGFYLNGNVVFYKDNFIYDDNLIEESLSVVNDLQKKLNVSKFNIYFGELPEKDFIPDYYYGKCVNGIIYKD